MARTFPASGLGLSPIDAYVTGEKPGGYFEQVITLDDTTERHCVEIIGTPTMYALGNYASLYILTTPAGTSGTWASSMFVKTSQTVNSIDGYICAAEFEVHKTGSYTNRDYAILVLNNANSVSGAQSSSAFILCREYGSNVLNALVKFGDNASYSATASTAVVVSAAADGVATHKVRFITNIADVATPMWFLATTAVPA